MGPGKCHLLTQLIPRIMDEAPVSEPMRTNVSLHLRLPLLHSSLGASGSGVFPQLTKDATGSRTINGLCRYVIDNLHLSADASRPIIDTSYSIVDTSGLQ